jgi:chromatin segregation and condensation protein Rec8/ScpA/Scc1 (kleisin family)
VSDLASKFWLDPFWLRALAEIDKDPLPNESPRDTYIRRLVAINVMRDIEEKFVEMERENER